jgi:hypothetical protein
MIAIFPSTLPLIFIPLLLTAASPGTHPALAAAWFTAGLTLVTD